MAVGQVAPGDRQIAGGGAVQPGQERQQRAFAGTAVALQNHQLAGRHIQVDLIDPHHRAVAQRIDAGQIGGMNNGFV